MKARIRIPYRVKYKTLMLIAISISISFISQTFISCTGSCNYHEPDLTEFRTKVNSSLLEEKLKEGMLTEGMPNYLFREVFKDCLKNKNIQVASFGSTQELLNNAPYFQYFQDPSIKIFLDIYNTKKDILYVWYGYQDFSTTRVQKGDTIFAYNGDKMEYAIVECLLAPRQLHIDRELSFPEISYLEIHEQNPNIVISYYYNAYVERNIIELETLSKDLYTVYELILGNKRINSFQFKPSK